jgi:ferritin-like metal-binding protein YciE
MRAGVARKDVNPMTTDAKDFYLTGLSNQHAVEKQAIETIEKQLSRAEKFPTLHSRMTQELDQTRTQMQRLETLLEKHGSKASTLKETVSSLVGSVSGVVHAPSGDDMVKNVLSAIGFKAYEIASYKALITSAELAGFSEDTSVLQQSMTEEQQMGDFLGTHLPEIVKAHVNAA